MSDLTARQREVVAFLEKEGLASSRRVAGELYMRSQDAGRILRALEKKEVVEFHVGERQSGYRLVPKDLWQPPFESIEFLEDLLADEAEALADHNQKESWIYTQMAKHNSRVEPEKTPRQEGIARWRADRARRFKELAARLSEREDKILADAEDEESDE